LKALALLIFGSVISCVDTKLESMDITTFFPADGIGVENPSDLE
jgi:hypothetical protein